MINKVMYVLNDFVRNIRVNVENVLFTDKINNESKLCMEDKVVCGPYSMIRNYVDVSNIILENIKNKTESYVYKIKSKSKSQKIVVFDVGANIGIYSLGFSKINNVTVYSFEPFVESYQFLSKNISFNNVKNIKAFNFGLTDKKQKLTMGSPLRKSKIFDWWNNSDAVESGCKTIYHDNKNKSIECDL